MGHSGLPEPRDPGSIPLGFSLLCTVPTLAGFLYDGKTVPAEQDCYSNPSRLRQSGTQKDQGSLFENE